ncbi:hypothetical protein COW81_00930, partial [Candidatus Campbellbacteria bacterium CG22_combo_CG10-13_8_21_14_all_36_13]
VGIKVHRKKRVASGIAREEVLYTYTENALRATFDSNSRGAESPVDPQAFLTDMVDQSENLVKSGEWIQVKDLRVGGMIAVAYGDRVVWERIVKIELQAQERVWDIEVNGTKNFIGNDIVAHNTYLNGGVEITGTATTSDIVPSTDSTYSIGTTLNRYASAFLDSITSGTMTLTSGSITDSGGAISFGNENLSTTGTLGAGNTTITGTLSSSGLASLNQASSTRFSIFDTLYVGGTSTSTLTSLSLLFPSTATLNSGGTLSINTTDNQSVTFGTGLVSGTNITFINATSTNATTTNIAITGNATFGNLTASRLLSLNSNGIVTNTDINSWITGTTNQITVTDDADGTVTLSLPQDVHTDATPTFAGLTLTGALTGTTLNFSGAGTTTGKLSSYSFVEAPYFTATSTTATSTFAGGLTVDTNSLVVDYSTNNIGI